MRYVITETIIQRFGINADNDTDAITATEQGQAEVIPGTRQVTRVANAIMETTPVTQKPAMPPPKV